MGNVKIFKSAFKPSLSNLMLLAFMWAGVGFVMGVMTLFGPVRLIVEFARTHNWSEGSENTAVRSCIGALVVISFIASAYLCANIIKARTIRRKITIPVITGILTIVSLALMLNPKVLKSFANERISNVTAQFAFGSYPSLDDLKRLKKEGYQNVISLLHPSVTPFEPMLLKEEKELCNKVGINLISIPMLPWVSQNAEAIEKVKQIAIHPAGKYYVHCYLGKDRVNMVKRIIGTYNENTASATTALPAHSLDTSSQFERGPVLKIDDRVFYTPYPTDEEYVSKIINAGVQKVISLMDSTVAEQRVRIEEERKLLAPYNIPFIVITVNDHEDMKQFEKLKLEIEPSKKPLVVHNFFSGRQDDLVLVERLKKSLGK